MNNLLILTILVTIHQAYSQSQTTKSYIFIPAQDNAVIFTPPADPYASKWTTMDTYKNEIIYLTQRKPDKNHPISITLPNKITPAFFGHSQYGGYSPQVLVEETAMETLKGWKKMPFEGPRMKLEYTIVKNKGNDIKELRTQSQPYMTTDSNDNKLNMKYDPLGKNYKFELQLKIETFANTYYGFSNSEGFIVLVSRNEYDNFKAGCGWSLNSTVRFTNKDDNEIYPIRQGYTSTTDRIGNTITFTGHDDDDTIELTLLSDPSKKYKGRFYRENLQFEVEADQRDMETLDESGWETVLQRLQQWRDDKKYFVIPPLNVGSKPDCDDKKSKIKQYNSQNNGDTHVEVKVDVNVDV